MLLRATPVWYVVTANTRPNVSLIPAFMLPTSHLMPTPNLLRLKLRSWKPVDSFVSDSLVIQATFYLILQLWLSPDDICSRRLHHDSSSHRGHGSHH